MSLRQARDYLEGPDPEKRNFLNKVGAALGGVFITSLAGCSTGGGNTPTATETVTVYDERTDGTPTALDRQTATDEDTESPTPSDTPTDSPTPTATPKPLTGKQVYEESIIENLADLEDSPFLETEAEIYDKFNDESLDTLQKELWQHEDLSLEQDLKTASTMEEKIQAYFINSAKMVRDRVGGAQLFQYFAHQDQEIHEQLGIENNLPHITKQNTRIDPRTLYDGQLGGGVTAIFKDENNNWNNHLAIPQFKFTDLKDYKGPAHQTDYFKIEEFGTSYISHGELMESIKKEYGSIDNVPDEVWKNIDENSDNILYGPKDAEGQLVISKAGMKLLEEVHTSRTSKLVPYLDKINEEHEKLSRDEYLAVHSKENSLILEKVGEETAEEIKRWQHYN